MVEKALSQKAKYFLLTLGQRQRISTYDTMHTVYINVQYTVYHTHINVIPWSLVHASMDGVQQSTAMHSSQEFISQETSHAFLLHFLTWSRNFFCVLIPLPRCCSVKTSGSLYTPGSSAALPFNVFFSIRNPG